MTTATPATISPTASPSPVGPCSVTSHRGAQRRLLQAPDSSRGEEALLGPAWPEGRIRLVRGVEALEAAFDD